MWALDARRIFRAVVLPDIPSSMCWTLYLILGGQFSSQYRKGTKATFTKKDKWRMNVEKITHLSADAVT